MGVLSPPSAEAGLQGFSRERCLWLMLVIRRRADLRGEPSHRGVPGTGRLEGAVCFLDPVFFKLRCGCVNAVSQNSEVCGLLELTLPGLGPNSTVWQDLGKYEKPKRLLDVYFE